MGINDKETFEKNLQNLIGGVSSLIEKLGLEGKLTFFPPIPIPLPDGSVHLFPPGPYFANLKQTDKESIDKLIGGWKYNVTLSMKEPFNFVMQKYAGNIMGIYEFLTLKYKPIIYFTGRKDAEIKYIESEVREEQEEIAEITQRFSDYFREDIEKAKQEFLEKIKRLSKPISESEIAEAIKDLYTEEEKEQIRRQKLREPGKRRELTRAVEENYSDEKAAELYRLMGNTDEYWKVVNKGIKRKKQKSSK